MTMELVTLIFVWAMTGVQFIALLSERTGMGIKACNIVFAILGLASAAHLQGWIP